MFGRSLRLVTDAYFLDVPLETQLLEISALKSNLHLIALIARQYVPAFVYYFPIFIQQSDKTNKDDKDGNESKTKMKNNIVEIFIKNS